MERRLCKWSSVLGEVVEWSSIYSLDGRKAGYGTGCSLNWVYKNTFDWYDYEASTWLLTSELGAFVETYWYSLCIDLPRIELKSQVLSMAKRGLLELVLQPKVIMSGVRICSLRANSVWETLTPREHLQKRWWSVSKLFSSTTLLSAFTTSLILSSCPCMNLRREGCPID